MKVLFLNGSSHAKGTTMRAIGEMAKVFEEAGVETEIIQIGPKPIADCLQCDYCSKHDKCAFDDDGVNNFVKKAKQSDGFVFASPVYYAHPSGRLLSFLDRAFYSGGKAFAFKPGAAIAVARRAGTSTTLDTINKYFGIAQMPIAGSTYWNEVHGLVASDADYDEEGLQTLRNLAKHIIWMMKCFECGKNNGIPLPDVSYDKRTNFIRHEFDKDN